MQKSYKDIWVAIYEAVVTDPVLLAQAAEEIEKNEQYMEEYLEEKRKELEQAIKTASDDFDAAYYQVQLDALPESGPINEIFCWAHLSDGCGWTCDCK